MPSPPPIPRIFSSSQIETLCPFNSNPLRPLLPPRPWQPPSYLLSLWIWLRRGPHVSGLIQRFCPFVSGSLACFQGRSMLQHVSKFHSRLKLRIFRCTCGPPFVYPSTSGDVKAVSALGLLWTMLLWTRAVCATELTLTYPSTWWCWKTRPSGGCRCRYVMKVRPSRWD